MSGVCAITSGIHAIAVRKCSELTCSAPASRDANASTSTNWWGLWTLRDHSKNRFAGLAAGGLGELVDQGEPLVAVLGPDSDLHHDEDHLRGLLRVRCACRVRRAEHITAGSGQPGVGVGSWCGHPNRGLVALEEHAIGIRAEPICGNALIGHGECWCTHRAVDFSEDYNRGFLGILAELSLTGLVHFGNLDRSRTRG